MRQAQKKNMVEKITIFFVLKILLFVLYGKMAFEQLLLLFMSAPVPKNILEYKLSHA